MLKYCVPNSIWKQINIHIDSVKDYSRKWTKREREESQGFYVLVYVAGVTLNRSIDTHAASIHKDQNVAKHMFTSLTRMLLFQQEWLLTISFYMYITHNIYCLIKEVTIEIPNINHDDTYERGNCG